MPLSRQAIPGVLEYEGARIQLLDLPGIVEGASQGRGRGRQVVATAKTADLILIMLDATKSDEQRRLLEIELDDIVNLPRDMRALEHEHRLASRERETLEAAEGRVREREESLKQREQQFRRRLTEELDVEVRRARREIDDVIAKLKAKSDAIPSETAKQTVTTGFTGAMRAASELRTCRRPAMGS